MNQDQYDLFSGSMHVSCLREMQAFVLLHLVGGNCINSHYLASLNFSVQLYKLLQINMQV